MAVVSGGGEPERMGKARHETDESEKSQQRRPGERQKRHGRSGEKISERPGRPGKRHGRQERSVERCLRCHGGQGVWTRGCHRGRG